MCSSTTLIVLAVVVVIVIVLVWYFHRNEGLTNAGRRVVYHYVEWCPACKAMNPTWYQVKQMLKPSNSIVMLELNEDIAKTDGIREYPTIDMIDEFGTKRVYSGANNAEALRNWIIAPQ